MTVATVQTGAERRLAGLTALEPAQAHARRRLGLPETDEPALRRVAERYATPAWAAGCISIHDAMFLYDMVRGLRPRRVIEVGVASGCSTAMLLIALADAGIPLLEGERRALESFELHPFCYFDRSRPVGSAVAEMAPELAAGLRLHVRGTAATAGRLLAGAGVELAFIDADHRHPAPTADLLALLPALAPDAWVVLHDIALPEIAQREEVRQGKKLNWHEHGAEWLFGHWPFEKFRGGRLGDRIGAANIGAIRLPGRAISAAELRELIELPWEVEPGEELRGLLGGGALRVGGAPAEVPGGQGAVLSGAQQNRGGPVAKPGEQEPPPARNASPPPPVGEGARVGGETISLSITTLIAPHGVSGVSSAMAKLATLGPPHHSWRVLVVGPGARAGKDVPGAAAAECVPWEPGLRPVAQVRLVRDRLRELDARVVSPNFLPQGFVAAALDRHRGRRCAAIWHGSELGAEDLYQRVAPLADAWRAVSPAIAQRIARYTAVPGAWLPTGVDVPGRFDSPPCTRDAARPVRLLYAAWLDERNKRVLDLAPLCDALHARKVPFQLSIAGRGPAQQKLAAALAAHIVGGRAAILGPIPHDDMARLHREHDMLVLTSTAEGTPVVVMEAMARGRPVAITQGCGGALAAVRDGIEGIVVPVGDMTAMAGKIAALLRRRGALVGMGARAHAAAKEHFDLTILAPRYDRLAEEAAAAPAGPDATDPRAIAELWSRILPAMELLGPSTPAELCGLALEWLADLGASCGLALHLTDDALSLLEPIAQFGPGMIRSVIGSAGGRWMGYPVVRPAAVPPGTLILTSQPDAAAAAGLERSMLIPLVEPWAPGLAARRLAAVMAELRAEGCGRVGLYGGGKHTKKLARHLAAFPEVAAVIDDAAGRAGGPPGHLWGFPVIAPDRLREHSIDAVIVSSDEYERTMLARARGWGVPVRALYEPITLPGGEIPDGALPA